MNIFKLKHDIYNGLHSLGINTLQKLCIVFYSLNLILFITVNNFNSYL
jgi:hypothetical protein